MSEASPVFIALVAGAILMLLVVSAGFLIYNGQKENLNTVMDESNKTANQLAESKWTQYEGAEVTGSEVISVIKQMKETDTFVTVNNGNGDVNYIYTDGATLTTKMTDAEYATALSKAKKRGSTEYINPNTRFTGEIVRDAVTEGILGIKFTKTSSLGTP